MRGVVDTNVWRTHQAEICVARASSGKHITLSVLEEITHPLVKAEETFAEVNWKHAPSRVQVN